MYLMFYVTTPHDNHNKKTHWIDMKNDQKIKYIPAKCQQGAKEDGKKQREKENSQKQTRQTENKRQCVHPYQ